MKPRLHAKSSAKKFGGIPEDYQDIHDWFDQTKAHHADVRHRAILHSTLGIFICEQVYGSYILNSDGKEVSVRDLGEQHVLEDLGRIPDVGDYLKNMAIQPWMGGVGKKIKDDVAKEVTPEGIRELRERLRERYRPPVNPNIILD